MHASHHAPLVTRMLVKLGAKKQKTSRPCRLEMVKCVGEDALYALFNDRVREGLRQGTPINVIAHDSKAQEGLEKIMPINVIADAIP